MQLKVLKHQSMSLSGEYLLRSIQNENLPIIDLLVRECIQNSLDASISDKTKVIVNIIINKCNCKILNKLFSGITDELNKRYTSNDVDFIAIRDSNTTGLTGPLHESELTGKNNFGNLRKLIYEFGRRQNDTGKGGSWGIGKTVCFRAGIGIVIYYSRVKLDNGTYQPRLAVTLIEDETKDNLLIPKSLSGKTPTGIAWWGDIDKSDDSSLPITDEKEISTILEIFNIPLYKNEETGTCIIIPYIDKQKLEENANTLKLLNNQDLEKIFKLTVERWYFPRLYNDKYIYGSQLDFRVNNRPIKEEESNIFFKKMQELYNYSTQILCNSSKSLPEDVYFSEIALRGNFINGQTAGFIVCKKFTIQELEMCPPNNCPSPYELLNTKFDDMQNLAIIAYCRYAGMIVNYEIRSAWTMGIPTQSKNEFLLIFFQPNGSNKLKNTNLTLDEYLRKSENADHHSWRDCTIDGKTTNIIEKIVKQIPNKVAALLNQNDEKKETKGDKLLQKKLGKAFLPKRGYGKRPGPVENIKSTNRKNIPHERNIEIKTSEPLFENNYLIIRYSLLIKSQKIKKIRLYFKAHTNSSEIPAYNWENELEKPFPVQIKEYTAKFKDENLTFNKLTSSHYDIWYGIELPIEIFQNSINGIIKFYYTDETISGKLIFETTI